MVKETSLQGELAEGSVFRGKPAREGSVVIDQCHRYPAESVAEDDLWG
jgi:hypothetical protein